LRELRRRRFFDHVELTDVLGFEPAISENEVFDLNGAETRRLVEQAMETLDRKGRTIVELFCFGGMTITEIATMTGESHGALQHRYYRAIEKLRKWIREAELKRSESIMREPATRRVEQKISREAKINPSEAKIGKAQIF
jgi:DNA-directed RNA polymerase specialized sigma24 family protein